MTIPEARGADRWKLVIVTFCGAGCSPVAPGTVGSLAAVGVAGLLHAFGWSSPFLLLGLALGVAVLNVALGSWIERFYGGKDPGSVVIDEVVGQWIALSVPLRLTDPWIAYPLAFVLFRLFDILKLAGAKRLEKFPRGWGVLLDDVLAGIYAGALLWGIGWLWFSS